MGVASGHFRVDEAFGSAAAALVGDDDGLIHQLVLGDDRLNHAREVVGAAARARGNDEFDRLARLPISLRHSAERNGEGRCNQP